MTMPEFLQVLPYKDNGIAADWIEEHSETPFAAIAVRQNLYNLNFRSDRQEDGWFWSGNGGGEGNGDGFGYGMGSGWTSGDCDAIRFDGQGGVIGCGGLGSRASENQ